MSRISNSKNHPPRGRWVPDVISAETFWAQPVPLRVTPLLLYKLLRQTSFSLPPTEANTGHTHSKDTLNSSYSVPTDVISKPLFTLSQHVALSKPFELPGPCPLLQKPQQQKSRPPATALFLLSSPEVGHAPTL